MLSVKMSRAHEQQLVMNKCKEKGKISFRFGNWPRKCVDTGNEGKRETARQTQRERETVRETFVYLFRCSSN